MEHTTIDEHRKVIRHRAAGYVRGENGPENAPFISMTESFACGNIVSTINDLFRWNEALFNGLVRPETLEVAFSPAKLKDGKVTDAGCGFGLSQIKGRKAVIHPGHLPGFFAYGLMVPTERLYVVWLSNRPPPMPRAPSDLVAELAAIAMNDPYQRRPAVELSSALLDAYAGVYVAPESRCIGGVEECRLDHRGALYLEILGDRFEAVPVSPTEFCLKERFLVSFTIQRDAEGATRLQFDWPLGVNQMLSRQDAHSPQGTSLP